MKYARRLLLAAANASIRYAKESAADAPAYLAKARQATNLLKKQQFDSATVEALEQELTMLQYKQKPAGG